MKVLIVCDEDALGEVLERALQRFGHTALLVTAPLEYEPSEDGGTQGYSPRMEARLLAAVQGFQPDWIWMMLQGFITRQLETLARIVGDSKKPRIFLFGGKPHEAELTRAREELGLSFVFELMPFNIRSAMELLNSDGQGV